MLHPLLSTDLSTLYMFDDQSIYFAVVIAYILVFLSIPTIVSKKEMRNITMFVDDTILPCFCRGNFSFHFEHNFLRELTFIFTQ